MDNRSQQEAGVWIGIIGVIFLGCYLGYTLLMLVIELFNYFV